jgi:hypothetical protein
MRFIQEHPELAAGSLQAAHGMFETLAAVVLSEELNRPIEDCLFEVLHDLVPAATDDVVREPSQAVFLYEECCVPDRRMSTGAFRRHARRFLDLLKERYLSGTESRGAQPPT